MVYSSASALPRNMRKSEDLGTVCNPWFCRRVPVNTGTSGVALIELCWKGEGLTKYHCGPISALCCNSCL